MIYTLKKKKTQGKEVHKETIGLAFLVYDILIYYKCKKIFIRRT